LGVDDLGFVFSVFSGKHHEISPGFYGFSINFYLDVFYLVMFFNGLGFIAIFLTNIWDNMFGSLFRSIEESQIQVIVKSFSLSLGNFWGKMIPNLPTKGLQQKTVSRSSVEGSYTKCLVGREESDIFVGCVF